MLTWVRRKRALQRFLVNEKTPAGVAQTVEFARFPALAQWRTSANSTVCATLAKPCIALVPTHLAYLFVFVPLLRRTHVKISLSHRQVALLFLRSLDVALWTP